MIRKKAGGRMILSDLSINEQCAGANRLIRPYNITQLQPASYDMLLGAIHAHALPYAIQPQEFLIASTYEVVEIPPWLVARIEGKSTWARRGLIIHAAGFVDPGFVGQLTLEIFNHAAEPIELTFGMRIAQIAFHKMDRVPEHLYGDPALGSHYQGQMGPTLAHNA